MRYIPYGRQSIDAADIREVIKVLRSDRITQGPKIREFEGALAGYCGAKYAVVVSSGTAALHLACIAAGLKKGKEAITSPITFLATPNSVFYAGARPVFGDIDYDSVNIDPRQIERRITKRTGVVLPVHFAGLPCEMGKIYAIARKNNLMVIEDACHALGAEYKINDRWFKVGSCRHSDMTVFSFHPVKHITTGEGGAVMTNDNKLYQRLLMLRNHGVTRDASFFKLDSSRLAGNWYYEMQYLGFNYRITDFQCALGISQLKKMDKFIEKRTEVAQRYNRAFKNIQEFLRLPAQDKSKKHAWHLYVLRLNLDKLKTTRKKVFCELSRRNLGVQVHYIPVYMQLFYRKMGYGKIKLKNSERYYEECISLPIYADLAGRTQDYIIKTIKKLINSYSRGE